MNKAPQLMDGILKSSNRITSIVGNLKKVARSDSGEMDEAIDVSTVVRSALMILQNQISKYSDNLVTDLPEDLPHVHGNFQHLGTGLDQYFTQCSPITAREN